MTTPTPPARRQRLRPEARIGQILDAALLAFSEQGYADTRMDDIARRAGLSKGGLYAHFASKEQLLEALFTQRLRPTLMAETLVMSEHSSIGTMVENFVDTLYARLQNASVMATLRLLITEGHRLPSATRLRLLQHRQGFIDAQRQIFERCIAQGLLRRSALTDHPELLTAPLVMALTALIALGPAAEPQTIAGIRQAHRRLLLDLLTPAGEPPSQRRSHRCSH